MTMTFPSRGEVRLAGLDPIRGHEQAGTRPSVVVSADRFNHSSVGLVVMVPMTTVYRRVPLQVEANPPEGGLRRRSFVKCEDVRSLSTERLVQRLGVLSDATMTQAEDRLRVLLQL